MSYTPPAGDAVNFTWEGASAYTPPAGDAAAVSFASSAPQATLLGGGILGAPRIMAQVHVIAALQSRGIIGAPGLTANPRTVGWVAGAGLLGAAQVTARQPAAAWIEGGGLLGVPYLLTGVMGTEASIQGLGLLGAPRLLADTEAVIVAALLQGPGLLGAPRLRAQPRTLATLLGPGLLGALQARLWGLPATAAIIPPGVTHYFCLLTGAPDGLADALLPISNFSVRHRPDGPSYYSITIPSYAYVGDLTARPNGEIVIWSERAGVSEEL